MNDILKYLKMIKTYNWFKGILYGIIIIAIYYTALHNMIFVDWALEDYSHCFLIPFVVLYLIWEKRDTMAAIASRPSWLGIIPLSCGVILFWLGELGGEFFTEYLSMWLVVVSLLWLHLGWEKVKKIGFALFIMLTMFPFPNFINTKILLKLKLVSSQLGVAMLQMSGMSAYREGNVIDLGFTQLQVVDACSGMRYVLPLMVLSLLMAYWYRAALWKKAVLVATSIPLAVLVNSLRIAMTGILYSFWGPAVAEGFFHGFSGWLIFLFTLPVLLLVMWSLNKVFREKSGDTFSHEPREGTPLQSEVKEVAESSMVKALTQPAFIAAIVLLSATFVFSHSVEFREKVPIKKSFDQFPSVIGEWKGNREIMEKQFIDALHFSDYLMLNYRNIAGQEIYFYVAYYESQRKGEATHSPETCLPGSGWEFKQSSLSTIKGGNGKNITINKTIMAKNNSRQLVYFWFPQRGRILTSLYQVKLYSFWDALIRQRTDGALVRIITPVGENENPAAAEERLNGFVKLMNPIIEQYIPQ